MRVTHQSEHAGLLPLDSEPRVQVRIGSDPRARQRSTFKTGLPRTHINLMQSRAPLNHEPSDPSRTPWAKTLDPRTVRTGSEQSELGQNSQNWVRTVRTGSEQSELGQNSQNWVRTVRTGLPPKQRVPLPTPLTPKNRNPVKNPPPPTPTQPSVRTGSSLTPPSEPEP